MKNTNVTSRPTHILYLDYLRILATFGVILIHVSAQNLENVPLGSMTWHIFNIANSIGRCSVAVFIMISGALFLDPDKAIHRSGLYRKKILRMVIVFLFWSAFYGADLLLSRADPQTVLVEFIKGHYHMWFLLMIIGLYIAVPVLRMITQSKTVTGYFLITGFVFFSLIPGIFTYLGFADLPVPRVYLSTLQNTLLSVNYCFAHSPVFFFVLGHYLARYDMPPALRRGAPLLWILGIASTALLTALSSQRQQYLDLTFVSDNLPHVMLTAMGGFLTAKYVLTKWTPGSLSIRVIGELSRDSFGVYLLHAFVLSKLDEWFQLNTLRFHPALSVPAILFSVFFLSCMISALLNRIPFVKKYIV